MMQFHTILNNIILVKPDTLSLTLDQYIHTLVKPDASLLTLEQCTYILVQPVAFSLSLEHYIHIVVKPDPLLLTFEQYMHILVKYFHKRVSFGSNDCTKELKLECAYFLGQIS